MKLYEALKLLEGYDSRYITIAGISKEDFHIRKIGLSIKIYTSESFRKKSKMFNTILFPSILSFENNDFIAHTEPKFKVGDLVAVDYPNSKHTGIIKEIDGDMIYLFREYNWHKENELTLIMPAQELAEKLGGRE